MVVCAAVVAGVLAGTAWADSNYVIREDTDIGGFRLTDDGRIAAFVIRSAWLLSC